MQFCYFMPDMHHMHTHSNKKKNKHVHIYIGQSHTINSAHYTSIIKFSKQNSKRPRMHCIYYIYILLHSFSALLVHTLTLFGDFYSTQPFIHLFIFFCLYFKEYDLQLNSNFKMCFVQCPESLFSICNHKLYFYIWLRYH